MSESFNFINKKYFINPTKTVMIGDSNADKEFAKNYKVIFCNVENIIS
ncbi:MAG: hypothetical protein CL827_01095 [Crocinitomicaceae bacterium]|nr:hypothetical protein [Crocinitomicaceae bacterium]